MEGPSRFSFESYHRKIADRGVYQCPGRQRIRIHIRGVHCDGGCRSFQSSLRTQNLQTLATRLRCTEDVLRLIAKGISNGTPSQVLDSTQLGKRARRSAINAGQHTQLQMSQLMHADDIAQRFAVCKTLTNSASETHCNALLASPIGMARSLDSMMHVSI